MPISQGPPKPAPELMARPRREMEMDEQQQCQCCGREPRNCATGGGAELWMESLPRRTMVCHSLPVEVHIGNVIEVSWLLFGPPGDNRIRKREIAIVLVGTETVEVSATDVVDNPGGDVVLKRLWTKGVCVSKEDDGT